MTPEHDALQDRSIRTFVALPVPSQAVQQIEAVQRRLIGLAGSENVKVRLTPTHQLHITLAFLGNIPRRRVALVIDATRDVASEFEAGLVLSTSGFIVFPSVRRPRVLCIALDDHSGVFLTAVSSLHQTLRTHGFDLEERVFRPHLTLARLPIPFSLDWSAAYLPVMDMTFDNITVYESQLSAQGSRYELLYRATLG